MFANVWFDENLYKIDPATGEVVDAYSLSELYPKVIFSFVCCMRPDTPVGTHGLLHRYVLTEQA